MRLSYPTNIKIIRLPCTGRIDVAHLLRAFEKGADGVYVVGCLEGSCHYNKGNLIARKRVEYVREKLEELGFGGDRLRMYNLSSGEAPTFVEYAREMYEHIKSLGSSPVNKGAKPDDG